MGIITSIIIALLSIIVDPSGIKSTTTGKIDNSIIVDPSGIKCNTTGTNDKAIIVDPSGKF